MRRIVILGDVHDRQDRLSTVLALLDGVDPDLALLAGDVGLDPPWLPSARETAREAHDESMRRTVFLVRDRLRCRTLFVPGNHDLRDPAPELDELNCDGRILRVAGLRIAGLGGSGPGRFGFPYEWTEREADVALGKILGQRAEEPLLLLCHTPPRDTTLDRTHRGDHVGSVSVRTWIGRARPELFVCGHIHEARGVERIDEVLCLNAGALGDPHGEELVWVVDWSDTGAVRIESRTRGRSGTVERRAWPTTG
jgi:Icc-related predicted phosphoesterase